MKNNSKSAMAIMAIAPFTFYTAMAQKSSERPNVIVILADDLGYGDVSANGSKTISTPNFDRVAENGCRFTRGFATSATSTPSRYAMMTGMYPWRVKADVLPGNAPLIINPSQATLPKMFQQAGYATGAVGKWHLGMGNGNVNWNELIAPGAKEVGFDYSYLMGATNDRVPCVYVENGRVDNLDPNDPIEVSYKQNYDGEPTGKSNPEMLKMHPSHGHDMSIVNGISRIGFMRGGKKALWKDETMAFVFLDKVKEFIVENKEKPFFLYYGLNQPHVPRAPHQNFVGKTTMGPRGDAIVEADWCVGQLLDHLKKNGLLENTIVILSSDNGPVVDDGYKDKAVELLGNHKPAGPLRGGKYSLFEGGTRIPFFISWPAKIKKGSSSDAIICHMDFLPSFAAMTGQQSPEGIDGIDIFKAMIGKSKQGRKELVLEAGGKLALKQGDYLMIPPYNGAAIYQYTNTESGNSKEYQLYNTTKDLGHTNNLAMKEPKRLEAMKAEFELLTKNVKNK